MHDPLENHSNMLILETAVLIKKKKLYIYIYIYIHHQYGGWVRFVKKAEGGDAFENFFFSPGL